MEKLILDNLHSVPNDDLFATKCRFSFFFLIFWIDLRSMKLTSSISVVKTIFCLLKCQFQICYSRSTMKLPPIKLNSKPLT